MKLVNRLYRILAFSLIFTLVALAFAQAVEPNWNVTAWAGSLLAFAGGVSAIMAVIRRYAWKSLDGDLVKGVAVAVGVATGIVLAIFNQFDSIAAGAVQGLLAGLGSFLGVDVLRDVVGGQGKAGE